MTLNGVTTGDARYLCSSWASCKLVCKMQTSCEFLEYCHFLHLVGRPTTVTTFYRDPFDFYRTSDISMSAQRRPEKSVRGWVISQGQQIDWDILLISPEILQEIKSLKIDLDFFYSSRVTFESLFFETERRIWTLKQTRGAPKIGMYGLCMYLV